jgi:hypothetical protein
MRNHVACSLCGVARQRASRGLQPAFESLDARVLLSSGGVRISTPETAAIEAARKKPKPRNLTKWAPLAADIVESGFEAPIPRSLDKPMEEDLERALAAGDLPAVGERQIAIVTLVSGRLPDVGKHQIAIVTQGFGYQTFDNNGGATYYTEVILQPSSAHPMDYAVQVWVPAVSPKTGMVAYAGQTNPTVFVATPPATPVDANRIIADLEFDLGAGQGRNLNLGPVNEVDLGETFVQNLTAAGFPQTAWDITINFGQIEIGNGGSALTGVGSILPDFQYSQPYYFQLYLDSNGSFTVNVFIEMGSTVPNLIPVSDPVNPPFSGITSPFRN